MLPVALLSQAIVTHLQDLDLTNVVQGWATAQKNKSVDGNPMRVGGVTYVEGIGTHATGDIRVKLDGGPFTFDALVGPDQETTTKGSIEFIVQVDGKIAWRSGVMRTGEAAKPVHVAGNAKELRLQVTDGGDDINYDHADWINPVLTSRVKPMIFRVPPPPAMEINTSIPDRAWIHGPHVVGGTPGKPFVFRIPASGVRPMKFTSVDLPPTLKLDPNTGVVTGTVPTYASARTTTKFSVTVKNAKGSDTREYAMLLDGNCSPTPPMGWNSWNVWGLDVTAEHVEAASSSFIKQGLADYGFRFVNIDDGWEAGRSATGEIELNKKFGDMADLSRRVHGEGLRLGIYSSPGPQTCGGYTGSWKHEKQDAETYAKWGIDYLKYDWCSYGSISKGDTLAELQKPYLLMRDGLKASSRDIVFSLCQYGMGDVWKWGHDVGGNCWRTTGDINDSWGSLRSIGFAQPDMKRPSNSRGFNDPDMLVVGYLGWSKNIRPTRLTPNEQILHMSIWSMASAPLLLGCDLTRLDKFTKALLTNHDVIEIDQEFAPQNVSVLSKNEEVEVWRRDLNDGRVVLGYFNKSDDQQVVQAPWSKLPAAKAVRDVWRQKDVPNGDKLTRQVPAHGAMLFILTPSLKTR